MRALLETLDAWRAEGAEPGRAVVIRTFGSAPRSEGAVLLVTDDGRLAGSVSGGCVEGAAAEEIARARRTGHARVVRYGISDEEAWDVGLACGGTIDVLIQPVVPAEVEAAVRGSGGPGGRSIVIATALPPDAPPVAFGEHRPGDGAPPEAPVVIDADGTMGGAALDGETAATLAAVASDALLLGRSRTVEAGGRQWFIEVYPVRPRLVIVGAVETARALIGYARALGYETIVIDGRAAFATRERFPDADQVVVGWPDEVADEIGLGPLDAVAILSHDPKFDEPAIRVSLARGCRYVGAVGSRKTQRDRRARLLAGGVPESDLARLRGPIGLDLGGREPSEMALSIMAEVVATRYGASGVPMRDRVATP